MHVGPFAPVKLCCELVCTVDLRCFEGRLSTVWAKGFAFSQPLRMFQTLRGLAEPPPPAPEPRLTGDQSCISSIHAMKREGEGREAVSPSQQTLLNSQQKQARSHHPLVPSLWQLFPHDAFCIFPTTSSFAFRF